MIKLNDNHKIITTFAIYLKKEEYVWSYITDVYPGEVTSRMRKVLGTYCCPFWLHITRKHEFKKIIRIEYYLETLQYSIQIRFVHFDFMVTKYQLFKFVRHKTWSTNVNGGDCVCVLTEHHLCSPLVSGAETSAGHRRWEGHCGVLLVQQ